MKLTFRVDKEEKENVDEILDEDPISRLSITQRDCSSLGFNEEGLFLILEGKEDICEMAEDELEDFVTKLEGEEREEVISAVKEAEEKSMKGFGSIFSE